MADERTKDKKYYVGREIGQLRAQVANREKSIAHYHDLVAKHTKALHRIKKQRDRARKLLKEFLLADAMFDMTDWCRRIRDEVEDNARK